RGGDRIVHREPLPDLVGRGALGGGASGGVGGGDQLVGVEDGAVGGAGEPGDVFFHEGAAEVVDAPAERFGGALQAHLDPAGRDVGDRAAEGEAEDGGVAEVVLDRDLLD